MTYSCCLSENLSPLVLDTSVLINLHASGYGTRLLSALPNMIIIPEVVALELDNDRSKSTGEHQFIHELVSSKGITIAGLSDDEYEAYKKLVATLDDGEAATIAIAASRGYTPVVDEHKGRLLAQEWCRTEIIGWSFDVLRHPEVLVALGPDSVDALYRALRDGRLRIHQDHCDEVVNLIGIKRAIQCTCLPGYKTRRALWQASLGL